MNVIALTAHHVSKIHTADGVCRGVVSMIDAGGSWLERLQTSMSNLYPT